MRAERAEFVAQLLRKHRDGSVNQIDRRSALLCLLVHDRSRKHIVRHVGDVYSYLVVTIVQLLE